MQHPRASALVTSSYGRSSRGPLGIYNFAGDVGKAVFPAVAALLLTGIAWRPVVGLPSVVGLTVGFILLALVPRQSIMAAAAEEETGAAGGNGRGFGRDPRAAPRLNDPRIAG